METNAQWAVQKALLAMLNADTSLGPILGSPVRLYDDIPDQPQFPFATFDRATASPIEAERPGAFEHVMTLKLWSRYGGRREALEGLHGLRDAIDDAALVLDGHHLVGIRTTFSDIFRVRSSRVFEAILTLRAVTEPLI